MPWCSDCDQYLAPPTVEVDGTCPTCHNAVVVSDRIDPSARDGKAELPPVPWHFKLFLGAFAVYLGFRAFQLIEVLF